MKRYIASRSNEINGYDLADEIYTRIKKSKNHDISLDDLIKVISFWGYSDGATGTIGFICSCAREKLQKIMKDAVNGNYRQLEQLLSKIKENKSNKY